jgi:hypothetical protein
MGSGMWFIAFALILLYNIYFLLLDYLSPLIYKYREAHPPNPARTKRNNLIFWGTWAAFLILIALFH